MATTSPQSLIMYIDPATAQQRKDQFATLKKKYIGNKDPYVDVAPQDFVNFSNQIGKLKGSGCWLYFGATDSNHLTVLVVPADAARKAIAGHYLQATAGGFKKVADADAQALIAAFQTNLLPQLEKDMGGQKESKALFYMADGLAQIANLITQNPTAYTALRVHFASYMPDSKMAPTPIVPLEMNVRNQLTIVFTLMTQSSGMKAMSTNSSASGDGDGGDYDTGVPCPPDNTCGVN